MPTIPTGQLERELRKLYLRWLVGVPRHQANMPAYISEFEVSSKLLIAKLGGQVASLGALADFPVPKLLELSPVAGVVYDDMQQAAIKAGVAAGLNATDTARQILNTGLGQSFNKLNRLARTETVSAYWKNSWDSIADLPLLVMVWGSEESKRTCEYCRSRDGLVIADGNIRDHPNGRCTPIPTLRSRVAYKGTLQPDGSVWMDPAWADKKVKSAKAKASAGPTTAEQRDPLSGKSNPAAPSKALPAHKNAGPKVADTSSKKIEAPQAPGATVVKPEKGRVFKEAEDVQLTHKGKVFTDAELDVLSDYSVSDYRILNGRLRGQVMSPAEIKAADARIKLMDDALAKTSLPESVTVTRSVNADAFKLPEIFSEKEIKALKGTVFEEPGYLSTSLSDKAVFKKDVLMQIDVPKGYEALYMGPHSGYANERELLLAKGSKLAITSVERKGSKWIVKASVMP